MFWKLYLIALPVFFALDMIWLVFVAKKFYARQLGALVKTDINRTAAVVFYLLFLMGAVLFVIAPAVAAGSWTYALWYGAAFGFITYATYDLTNLATLKDWPLLVSIVDMAWGTLLGASVSMITYFIAASIGL